MKKIYITEAQKNKIFSFLNEGDDNVVLLNEENRAQKKKCVEHILNNMHPMVLNYAHTRLIDLPSYMKNMLNPDGALFKSISQNTSGCDKFIDFLRINLYQQFGIGRGSNLVQFIPGIARIACTNCRFYAFDLSVKGGQVIELSRLLKLIDRKPEYMLSDINLDSDLNGLSYNELMDLFSDKMKTYVSNTRSALSSNEYKITKTSDYTIIPIEDKILDRGGMKVLVPTDYGRMVLNRLTAYTDWCVCGDRYADEEFSQYLSNGGKMYVCLKNGFENIKRPETTKTALDEYGLSMICVIVGEDGLPTNVTTRYNHDFGGENHSEMWEATHLQKVLNVNYYKVFKPRPKNDLRKLHLAEDKKPSAQDQVKGKVNAGIMDGVTGCGMMEEEMLCENQNDKLANDYIKNTIGVKDFQDIRDYIFQICHAIPNVRFNKRYYLLGVIRLVYEEKLRGRHLSELNNILYNIRERNDILDRNLDGLSFIDLWEEYYNTEDGVNNVDSVEKIRKTPTGYVIKHIESYDESYNSGPQDWCITYDEEFYYSVASEGDCIYIVENPEMMKSIDINSKEFVYACRMMGDPTLYDLGEYGSGEPPYDTYGLSRFVVLVNPNGTYVYSRWNIPDELDGQFLNREELEEIVGMPFNDAFPYVKPYEVDDEIKQHYCLRESIENKDDEFKIEGVTEEADSFKNAFKPIANFMKNEGLNVYPFPKLELNWDEQDGLFIKTGYYLPCEKKVVLFCKDRHPKDILRSFTHEMIHHMQNLNGDDLNFTSDDDVKDNDKLEKLESEAYLKGNIYFRKWTEHESKNSDGTLNESVLKESPDSIENPILGYDDDNAYPFIAVKGFPNDILVGINGSTHWDMVERIEEDAEEGENTYRVSQELLDAVKNREVKLAITSYYEFYGRYWSDDGEGGHIISLWGYDKNDYHKAYSDIVRTVGKMQDEGIEIDWSTLDFDDWRRKFPSFRYPVTWLGNGMADIYIPRAKKITKENGFYIIFLDNGRVLRVNKKGDVVGEAIPSYLNENVVCTPKVDESLTPSEVDLSSFNIKKELNPKFWKDDKLDSRIRIKLLDIADDFIEFLGIDWVKPEDITITGSLANYNWNKKYSDIDLHILIDYSKVDKKTDFVNNYFYSQKKLWNEEHKDLRIFGFPVEVYVQDVNKKHTSSGVYSLEKNEWVIEPEREKLSKKKVDKKRIKKNVSQYTEKIDKLVDNSKNTNGDDYKIRKVYEDAQQLFDEIKKLRRENLSDANNEINEGNIIFKALRRLGYIDKLDKVINKGYNTLNSLP